MRIPKHVQTSTKTNVAKNTANKKVISSKQVEQLPVCCFADFFFKSSALKLAFLFVQRVWSNMFFSLFCFVELIFCLASFFLAVSGAFCFCLQLFLFGFFLLIVFYWLKHFLLEEFFCCLCFFRLLCFQVCITCFCSSESFTKICHCTPPSVFKEALSGVCVQQEAVTGGELKEYRTYWVMCLCYWSDHMQKKISVTCRKGKVVVRI